MLQVSQLHGLPTISCGYCESLPSVWMTLASLYDSLSNNGHTFSLLLPYSLSHFFPPPPPLLPSPPLPLSLLLLLSLLLPLLLLPLPLPRWYTDTLDDDDEVLWALAEQLGDKDFVVFVGGPDYAHTLIVSASASQ